MALGGEEQETLPRRTQTPGTQGVLFTLGASPCVGTLLSMMPPHTVSGEPGKGRGSH